jgi:hypothetical protein
VYASGRTIPECSGDCDQFPGLPGQQPGNYKEIAFTGPDWKNGISDLNWYVCRSKRHMFQVKTVRWVQNRDTADNGTNGTLR